MESNQIIKYDNRQLSKVGNALAVTNKLLGLTEPKLIPYRKKDKWGFCTPDKKIVIDCIYEDAYQFFEGLARVKLNGKYGFINKGGFVVIPFQYDTSTDFSRGFASVTLDTKRGKVNKENNFTEIEENNLLSVTAITKKWKKIKIKQLLALADL